MPATIKTPQETEKMRVAGQLASTVLEMIEPYVKAGISTGELNDICHDYIVNDLNAIPAPLNYHPPGYSRPFPKSICTSLNHVVCHGIPGERKLKNGDILNIDVTVIKDGFHGDTSKMFLIGKPSIIAQRLVRVAYEAMRAGIAMVQPGARLGDIGYRIQSHCKTHHYSVVTQFCGHGIGREFHEEPQVLHYGKPGTGLELVPGMTFTIEPMVNAGGERVKLMPDGWTVVTKDHSLSAQWEHTVLVTEDGHEVLTRRADEQF